PGVVLARQHALVANAAEQNAEATVVGGEKPGGPERTGREKDVAALGDLLKVVDRRSRVAEAATQHVHDVRARVVGSALGLLRSLDEALLQEALCFGPGERLRVLVAVARRLVASATVPRVLPALEDATIDDLKRVGSAVGVRELALGKSLGKRRVFPSFLP